MSLALPARIIALVASFALAGCGEDLPAAQADLGGPARLVADGPLLDADLPRYGLNLGSANRWGAEQLRANILWNPGFEPTVDRAVVVVKEAASGRVVDDTPWLARPDGFWDGARYDVRSGAAAGKGGNVLASRKRPGDGLAELNLDGDASRALQPGDVVVLSREQALDVAPLWWRGEGRVANARDTRPGSPGTQSARLLALPGQPAALLHHFDNIAARAGKLLPVEGRWRLALWVRSPDPRARLELRLGRDSRAPFLDTPITPTAEWQRHEFEFTAEDGGPAGVLTLTLRARDGEVQLDDAWLGEAEPGPGGFRRAVVDTLRTLAPGYLRDWQGQLGDPLANRIADEHARRGSRYRPGDTAIQFHYGLPDFLALCAAIGAQPWIVAPTTLDDGEWRAFGAWLRQAADEHGFREMLVEFGNENWNPLFRAAGILEPRAHAAVADRGFALLREGSGNDPRLRLVVNAQYANPDSPRSIGAASREADRVAVAPYFLHRLDAGLTSAAAQAAAFADDGDKLADEAQDTAARGKRLAVYEVNFHTTGGSAPAAQRDALVTGASSAAALAQRLLQATRAGAREQAVYTLAGFDAFADDGKALVRLWGVTRDLAAADRLRPTGLALALLNRGAGGATRAMRCSGADCEGITAVAFDAGRRVAVVSARPTATPLRIALPCPAAGLRVEWIDGSEPSPNNEREPQVRIAEDIAECEDGEASVVLPAYSVALLAP